MGKVLSHIRFMLWSGKGEMPERVVAQWVEASQLNAERINAKRKESVGNALAFDTRVSATSSKGYRKLLNPDFVSRSGLKAREIVNRQRENLKKAYNKYKQSLDYAFETVDGEPAKRFKERIARAKEHYAKGAGTKVLPFSGSRTGIRGIMTLVPEWLTRDIRIEGHLRPADEIVGGASIMICKPQARSGLRVFLAGRLQQAGVAIIDANYSKTETKEQNDLTNSLLNGFVDPALNLAEFETDGDSFVNFLTTKDGLSFLEVKVSSQ